MKPGMRRLKNSYHKDLPLTSCKSGAKLANSGWGTES